MLKKWKKPGWSKKIAAVTLTAAILLGSILPAAAAQTQGAPNSSNLHPLEFGQTSQYGYIPVNTGIDPGAVINFMDDDLPASFDLRAQNRVTSVKDQNPYGTCWAFASIGSAESSMLGGGYGAQDYAERHLVYFTFHNSKDSYYLADQNDLNVGGNAFMWAGTLARWSGAELETNAPYSHKTINSSNFNTEYALPASQNTASYSHLQKALFMDMADVSGIKQTLMDEGAVSVIYWAEDAIGGAVGSYFNTSTNAYFTGSDQGRGGNHNVLIVGWDDNYPASNFSRTAKPAHNGAWLIKNSWGSDWGDNGYFWISYEEPTLDLPVYFGMESSDNYDKNYQYDEAGYSGYFGDGTPETMAANVFTSEEDETLKAVSFYTLNYDNAYAIQIYTDLKDPANPTSGTPVYSDTAVPNGILHTPGYYTIPLDSPVRLKAGQTFSVVVALQNLQDIPALFALEMENPITAGNAIGFRYEAQEGQSFVLNGGWFDASGFGNAGNVCIKAFTDVVRPADKTALDAAILRAQALTHSEYYQASAWSKMQAVLSNALAVQKEQDLTSEEQVIVDAAASSLNSAIDALDTALAPADKTALKAALTAAAEKQKEQSDFSNWDAAVKAPLAAAKQLDGDATLTFRDDQARVDNAAAALNAALEKLTYKAADKTALASLLSVNTGKNQELYTEITWSAFDTAYKNAQKIIDNTALTIKDQSIIDDAAAALSAAATALKMKPADKSALESLVKEAEEKEGLIELYTPSSLATLLLTAEDARNLLKEDLTVADKDRIDQMAKTLKEAIDGLEIRPAKTAALEEKLAAARALLTSAQASGHYTAASVAALDAAITDAAKLLAQEGLNITNQGQFDAMVTKLDIAMTLELKPADKTALRAKVSEVGGLSEALYQSGWAAFETALAEANRLLADSSLTIEDQGEIDGALATLTSAAGALVFQPADTASLQAKVAEVKELKEENYASGWQDFADALTKAEALLKNTALDIRNQAEIDSALAALNAAYDKLEGKKADKTALTALYEQNKDKTNADGRYTADSYLEFTDALRQAKDTLDAPDASHEAITQATARLRRAAANLVDRSTLGDALTLVQGYQASGQADKLTAEQRKEFDIALQSAQAVYGQADATQQQMDDTWKLLTDMMQTLGFVTGEKTELAALCGKAAALSLTDYQDGVEKQAFIDALAEANKALEDPDALQVELDAALRSLDAAMKNLVPVSAGSGVKTELNKVIDKASLYSLDLYVDAGKAAFEEALDAARAAARKDNAGQTEIDNAKFDLLTAMAGLRLRADKASLTGWLDTLKGIDLSSYTSESAEALRAVLVRAEALAARDLSVADAVLIQAMMAEMANAQAGLTRPTPKEETPEDTNRPETASPETASSESGGAAEAVTASSQGGAKQKAPTTGDIASISAGILLAAAGGVLFLLKRKQG